MYDGEILIYKYKMYPYHGPTYFHDPKQLNGNFFIKEHKKRNMATRLCPPPLKKSILFALKKISSLYLLELI